MIAQEVMDLMNNGRSWNDACKFVAKKYGVTLNEVVKAYEQEYGRHPKDNE